MAPDSALIGGAPDRGCAGPRLALRVLGALLLFGIGAVHLQQYLGVYYRVIPVIGDLFAANFSMAVLLGLLLLAPLERIGRLGRPLPARIALGGIGFAAGTIIGLEPSELGTLFGFHEHGYRLSIVLCLALEAAAIVVLAAFLTLQARTARSDRDNGSAHRPQRRGASGLRHIHGRTVSTAHPHPTSPAAKSCPGEGSAVGRVAPPDVD